MLRFNNFELESNNDLLRADLRSDREGAYFIVDEDMNPAEDDQQRALVEITVPLVERVSVVDLQAGLKRILNEFIRPIEQNPGVFEVAENAGLHFAFGGFDDRGLPRGQTNHFGPLILRELVPPQPSEQLSSEE
jgi:hypothetical protein